jgi:mannosyl-oligosaccharide glucosidase
LSKQDKNYGTDEKYWRGAIWMNLNVLATLRLHDLGKQEGSEQNRTRRLALELRENVIRTVYNSWSETGFVWEQYSDTTGKGQRSRAFTGWTACVLLLMGMDGGVDAPAHEHHAWHGEETLDLLSTPVMFGAVGLMASLVLLRRRIKRVSNPVLQWIRRQN